MLGSLSTSGLHERPTAFSAIRKLYLSFTGGWRPEWVILLALTVFGSRVLTSIVGYLSWRKLGDVAASLYALGYHQQQTEAFRSAPPFLRELRQIAFCRTYSADKNVSIFLGRPPRILRKFCQFYLPGTPTQPTQRASRRPAVWDSTEKPNFATDSKWAAVCGILKEDILDLFTEENYEERARRGQYVVFASTVSWPFANFILQAY